MRLFHQPARVPKMLFEGKVIASVFCENEDLSGASFDGSTIYEVTFDHCNLLKCTFRGALIKKIKFIQCGEGASFDDEPLVDENSEVTIVRTDGAGHEVYLGAEITKVAKEFGGRSVPRVKPPKDIPKQAIAIIFSSLFKADKHRLDYPEKHKIEHRLRAWLSNFSLDQSQVRDLLQAFSRGLGDLKDQGWICLNPN